MGLFGTLFDDILTGGGAIAGRQARNAQDLQSAYNQQAIDLQKRQLDNYDRYANQASGMNDRYAQMGLDDRNSGQNNLANLFSQYAGMNNIQGYNAPQATAGQSAYNRTPDNRLNAMTGAQGQQASPPVGGQQSAYAGNSPYDAPSVGTMTPAQQQQTNQRVDAINNARMQALQEYRARAGGQVNSAMEQYINEQYDRQVNELHSNAEEASRQQAVENWRYGRGEQQTALQNMLNYYAGQRQQGTNQYGNAINTNLNLAQAAPYANASQLQQNMANQQAQYAQQMQQLAQQRIGSMINLAAFGLGGGFGGAARSATNFGGGGSNALSYDPTAGGVYRYVPGMTDPSQYALYPNGY